MKTDLEIHLEEYVSFLLGYPLQKTYHRLLLACMPKSGSTWLCTMLACLPKFRSVVLVNGYDRREQELSEIQLLLNQHWNYVSQMHIRYSEPTARLIERFSLRPIVLVRNIFDIVPSIRDRWQIESVRGPACFVNAEITSWPREKVDEFIIDMVLPWYFNFFLSWTECESKFLLTYEEMHEDPHRLLKRISDQYLIEATSSEIDEAIHAADMCQFTRRNKAEVGRGESLSNAAVQKILKMASYHEGVDFTSIGITSEPRSPGHGYILSARIRAHSESTIVPISAPENEHTLC